MGKMKLADTLVDGDYIRSPDDDAIIRIEWVTRWGSCILLRLEDGRLKAYHPSKWIQTYEQPMEHVEYYNTAQALKKTIPNNFTT